jgi:hypothetical protein
MKRSLVVSTLVVGAALAVATIAGQQRPASRSGIEGVWRAIEVTTTGPNATTRKDLQPNLSIFTAKHYSQMAVVSDKPRPEMKFGEAASASAEQLRAVWGPFIANAGTYEVKGDEIILKALVAKMPATMAPGNGLTVSFNLDGNTLTTTTKSNRAGPVANPTTIKYTRVE